MLFDDIVAILSSAELMGYVWQGFLHTLIVTFVAAGIGLVLGFAVALVKISATQSRWMKIPGVICNLYTTVIRGTPVALQLFIMVFAVLAIPGFKPYAAILTFGINSGAYQAEILRAGIMSIDPGQMEAGRALGLGYWKTMLRIVLPQAIRNVLPALGNEFIVLMKDTSIVGYIALRDLAKGGDIIRSQTYSVYTPYLTVAAIYLVLVMTFTWLLGKLERHLRNTGADVVHNDS